MLFNNQSFEGHLHIVNLADELTHCQINLNLAVKICSVQIILTPNGPLSFSTVVPQKCIGLNYSTTLRYKKVSFVH